jgi:membrane protein required for colicin V production
MFASYYDIIFFGIISFSAIIAFIRGGMVEILSLSVWFIAFWMMRQFGGAMDALIPTTITNHLIRSAIIFIVSFIIVAIIIAIIKKLLANVINAIGLGGLDYLIGILFGIVRGLLICAILVVVLKMLNFDNNNEWQKSKLSPALEPVVSFIVNTIPKKFGELPKPPSIDIFHN